VSFFEKISGGIKNYFDKKKEEREFEEQLRSQASIQERIEYEKQFKLHALAAAKIKAKKQAEESTGIAKLRAIAHEKTLDNPPENKGNFFSRFSEYTKKNMANREKNMKRTNAVREEAEKMKAARLNRFKNPRTIAQQTQHPKWY
jgi:hypothetical protein